MARVAYVCADPGVPVFGAKGASVHVQEVLRALVRAGHDVVLFAARLDGIAAIDGVEVVPLPLPKGRDPLERERAALAANGTLADALRTQAPFDLIYERYSLFSYAGMATAADVGAVGVLEVNAPLIEEQDRHRGLGDRRAAENIASRVFRDADLVIAVSPLVASWVERWSPSRLEVVPNGVDPARFAVPIAVDPHSFTVGFVGTLKPWHGLDVLAAAFARVARDDVAWRLLVVGDGPERASLQQQLSPVAERCHFTGAVPPADVPELLSRMDVAVAPYSDGAGCYFSPLKLFEYLAAGVPVVASAAGQILDVVRNGHDAVLVPPGDADELAAALRRLRADDGLRQRLSRNARTTVVERHTWDHVVGSVVGMAFAADGVPA